MMSATETRPGRPVVVTADPVDAQGYVMFRNPDGLLVGFWHPDAGRKVPTPAFVVSTLAATRVPTSALTANGFPVGRARSARVALLAVEFGLGVIALGLAQRVGNLAEWYGTRFGVAGGVVVSVREAPPERGDLGRRWVAYDDLDMVGRGRTWYEAARLLAARVFPDESTTNG